VPYVLKGEWYDLRDLANPIRELLQELGLGRDADYVIWSIAGAVGILLWLILSALIFIWLERRVVALMQNRIGPNRVGPNGLLQPIADAIKLLLKEAITPSSTDRLVFWLGPIIIFIPAIVVFAVIPFGESMALADLNVGVLFLIAASGIMTPAVFMAGWASHNKYALLGSMRTIAMMISYEIIQVLALVAAVVFVGTMRLQGIVGWQDEFNTWLLFIQPMGLAAFIIAGAVEINRSPMDISEAESELAAGYHTEYSGIKFGFFYQAEYLAGFAVAAAATAIYFGGWTAWGLEEYVPGWIIFIGKTYLFFFVYIWARGTLPRLRIDQLMSFAWKFMLPLMLVNVLVVGAETLIWHETEASRNIALPAIAAINVTLMVVLVVGWARFLGHGTGKQSGHRATLTREVGKIYYEGVEA
jgi:NADH-quinone oxidoreductase subunit H